MLDLKMLSVQYQVKHSVLAVHAQLEPIIDRFNFDAHPHEFNEL